MLFKKLTLILKASLITILILSHNQINAQTPRQLFNAEVKPITFIKTTKPVRDIKTVHDGVIVKFPKDGYHPKNDWPLNESVNPNALPIGADPAWQKEYASRNPQRTLNINWDGISDDGTGFAPGDPSLDVGPNHVVQMANASGGSVVEIRDKSGNVLTNFIFDGVTGIGGLGDPIVIYDQLADRWLLSEFAFAGNRLVVAISTTPDPTGSYFIYSFDTPDFPDYPKYSIWEDSYIVTTNESEPRIYALDRARMLAGDPTATFQQFEIALLGTLFFQTATPVNLDGTVLPPSGSPAMFMRMADDAWDAGPTQDRLEIFELDVDFNNPANSSVTGPIILPTDPFDTSLNGFISFSAIPQPGTTLELDPLREVLMNKILYRNFGTYEALVCNHVTDVTGNDDAGVRWYELRRVGGPTNPWVIHQQGTYSPDNTSRWMGAIGINADGSIGLAYNVSDATSVFPGLRFTGRLECDPLGQMTFPETSIIEGQTSSSTNRYGDYNTISVDPIDGTFWFVGQYNKPGEVWSSRVANFELALNCSEFIVLSNIDFGQTVCPGDDAVYDFELDFDGGFTGNVTFSASGLPAGAMASFSTNPANAPGIYTMTVSGTAAVPTGSSTINILATDGTESSDINVQLTVDNNQSQIGIECTITCADLAVNTDCDCLAVTNVALQGIASMSSMFNGTLVADNLNDGVITDNNEDLAHTSGGSPTEWVEIDLGSSMDIAAIAIQNRTNCCSDRLNNAFVLVSPTPFPSSTNLTNALNNATFTYQLGNAEGVAHIGVDIYTTGRYVRIQKSGDNDGNNDAINLRELQIFVEDTAVPVEGEACDDGIVCTTGATYNSNCQCTGGIEMDSDNDGVCDADDQCPNFNDNMIGQPCDDGIACTVGETYATDCECTGGSLQDVDNDGICDSDDQCPNLDDGLIGTSCDDNDPCTLNDVYTSNCDCAGTPDGDSDNDGICDSDDQCPNFDDNLIGQPCDDNIICFEGSTWDINCNCTGGAFADTDGDGICDPLDQCPGFDDDIDTDNNGVPDGCEESCLDYIVESTNSIITEDRSANIGISTNGRVFFGNFDYHAGQEVLLTGGFEVRNGAVFHAFIAPCN